MDITRNWRLKTSRVQLLATRCPATGEVVIPQQSACAVQPVELYTFQMAEELHMSESEYAKAAR